VLVANAGSTSSARLPLSRMVLRKEQTRARVGMARGRGKAWGALLT
jgi:hypothetical protein